MNRTLYERQWIGPTLIVTLLVIALLAYYVYPTTNQISIGATQNEGFAFRIPDQDTFLSLFGIACVCIGAWLIPHYQFLLLSVERQNRALAKRYTEKWKTWSPRQRLEFYKRVHFILCEKYSLEQSRIKLTDLQFDNEGARTGIRGEYWHAENKILLDIDRINNHDVIRDLETLLHETRHSIQYELIDLYRRKKNQIDLPPSVTLEQVKSWCDNRTDYQKYGDDFERYYSQILEVDARAFAKQASPYFVRLALSMPTNGLEPW